MTARARVIALFVALALAAFVLGRAIRVSAECHASGGVLKGGIGRGWTCERHAR